MNTIKVKILSFSFKHGRPEDPEGHGGGFIFDCRSLPNPFWDKNIRHYTGCDQPVADFFDNYPERVNPFLEAAERLVRLAINAYLSDGRTALQVAFGCTGGQHRSVYFAERLAANLRNTPNVTIEVIHAAKQYWKTV